LEHGASQLNKSTKAPRFSHGQEGTLSEPVSAGQVNQQQGETSKEAGRQAEESDLLSEWTDAVAKGYTVADFKTWTEERHRDKRLLSKWGRGLFLSKSPPGTLLATRVTMSAGKEVREDIPVQALDPTQQHVNLPSKETTICVYPEGREWTSEKGDEGVNFDATSSDEERIEEGPDEGEGSPEEEAPAFQADKQPAGSQAQTAESTAAMPSQPHEEKAESAKPPITALAASQPQTGQPDNQPSTHDKTGRISPLSDVTFNPPGISTS
jgi:hypothetical protein